MSEFGPDDWLAITHGNGPQSGNLSVQMEAARDKVPVQDLDVIGAMTPGQIGYMLQNTMQKHLKAHGIDKNVIAVVNQVLIDPDDPEFTGDTCSKPVGNFFTEEEAKALKAPACGVRRQTGETGGGEGWRRCVPPHPQRQRRRPGPPRRSWPRASS